MSDAVSASAERVTALVRDLLAAERVAGRDGFLQRRDPAVVTAAVAGCVVAATLAWSPGVLAAVAAVTVALAAASGVSLRRLTARSIAIPAFATVAVLPQAALIPGEPVGSALGVTVTGAGLRYVAVFVARVAVAVGLVSLLVLTVPFSGVVGTMRRAGVSAPVVRVIATTYRYVVLLAHELRRRLLARRGRRPADGNGGVRAGWRDARRLLAATLTRSLDRGRRIARGARARGGARPPSPYVRRERLDAGDALLLAVAACLLACSVVVRWAA